MYFILLVKHKSHSTESQDEIYGINHGRTRNTVRMAEPEGGTYRLLEIKK